MAGSRIRRNLLLGVALVWCAIFASAARANETVLICDVYGDNAAPLPAGVYGIGASIACPGNPSGSPPGGMAIWTVRNRTVHQGAAVQWTVNAPVDMTIAGVYIPHMFSIGIDDDIGWAGD